jgi:hypothetical protein
MWWSACLRKCYRATDLILIIGIWNLLGDARPHDHRSRDFDFKDARGHRLHVHAAPFPLFARRQLKLMLLAVEIKGGPLSVFYVPWCSWVDVVLVLLLLGARGPCI